jgi:SAM-dependent methyltransferase
MATPRRLVFGDVAELYDRHRPTYPGALIDDLIADGDAGIRAGRRALEVGAGTGKATELFAARGVAVLAIEPSPGMAEIARRKFAATADVTIVQSDFERWDPAGERFGLVYSAQAWHWIDPEVRYQRARQALAPGGLLAAFWNRPAWGPSDLRDALLTVYAELAPELSTDGSMHPAASRSDSEDEEWAGELATATGFADPHCRTYGWDQLSTAPAYVGTLATLSEYRLLDPDRRERILAAVRDEIDAHGGTVTMAMATLLCTARAA